MTTMFSKFVDSCGRARRIVFALTGCALALTTMQAFEAQADETVGLKAELIASSPIFEFIANNFEADLDLMVADLATSIAAGVDPRLAGQEAMLSFRGRHAADIGAANDEAQRALLEGMIHFHEVVLAEEGPKVCALFASYGYPGFHGTPLAEKYEDMQMEYALQTLSTTKAGVEQPVRRDAVSDADNTAVGEAMVALGATEAQLDAIANQTTKDAALCDGMLTLMRAMNTDGDTAGARLRAEFLAAVAAV